MIFSCRGYEKEALKRLGTWASKWRKAGVALILRVKFTAAASQSVLSTLDNTQEWSKEDFGDFSCPCQLPFAAGLAKVRGHMLAPMMGTVARLTEQTIPAGWTVRSRCIPDFVKETKKVQEKFHGVMKRLGGKLAKRVPRLSEKIINLEWTATDQSLLKFWNQALPSFQGAWHAAVLGFIKKALKCFVLSPMDKLPSDGAIL